MPKVGKNEKQSHHETRILMGKRGVAVDGRTRDITLAVQERKHRRVGGEPRQKHRQGNCVLPTSKNIIIFSYESSCSERPGSTEFIVAERRQANTAQG